MVIVFSVAALPITYVDGGLGDRSGEDSGVMDIYESLDVTA